MHDFDDRDPVSPGYSVAFVARYWDRALPRAVGPVDADDCAPWLAQTAKEVDWSIRTAWALSKPYPLEWIGISWASLNWPQSDHDGAPEGGIVQAFPWPDADDCAPGLEAMPPQPGLAVAVVLTDRGMVHQLQRDGDRVCEVASWGAIPVIVRMLWDAGLPGHAVAFRRWHDIDCDAMDREGS